MRKKKTVLISNTKLFNCEYSKIIMKQKLNKTKQVKINLNNSTFREKFNFDDKKVIFIIKFRPRHCVLYTKIKY